MKRIKSTQGIGLLESLLSIALAALVLVLGLHWYQQSKVESRILGAETQARRLLEALYHFPGRASTHTQDVMPDLVGSGVVNSSDQSNPWGGTVTVSGNQDDHWQMRMSQIPLTACRVLTRRIRSMDAELVFHCNSE